MEGRPSIDSDVLQESLSSHHTDEPLQETVKKIVTEKFVDSPEEAAREMKEEPPPVTMTRAKRLIDNGLHMHDDIEYVHTIVKASGTKKKHGMWHLKITPDNLKTIMNDAEFDTGEHSY